MNTALNIENLHKSFKTGFTLKKKKILKGISLSVEQGEIFGYLGPNGAGKTTTIKCILGLIFPEQGEIKILGYPYLSLQSKERLGFLPENPYFYDYLTAQEFLDFYSRLYHLPSKQTKDKIRYLIKLVGLERSTNLQLRKFSKGMLQRIGLAQALVNDPELVILDEPLGGLDPLGRKELRDIIVQLKEEGKTIFLSSHILQDIEMICDKVAIILDGRIVSQGKLQELISEKILFTEIIVSGVDQTDLQPHTTDMSFQGDKIFIKVFQEEKINDILSLIQEKKGKIHSLISRTPTLEDLFIGTVKKT
ncbi:MAG: ABC transporter ATP-binding protein [Candidatus Aminicenantes bacterium]|nr:ABC transporter ATP-binding protein [Candidatus Aminicenantes bacterium]